ncbi:hypothetical protein GCM10011322_17710 [Salinarimonas ramus]|uniref:Uncharacterized protein n=1 Tax=Salinarimonas ramus TaxID=690164 RepID=A0A917V3H0_9HYPH|nr:hypothetical protein GCM10011322_17710 [Salinarimonas ramus]
MLGTVNAPLKRQISASDLSRCLVSADPDPWLVHVAAYFNELSTDLILEFAHVHDVDGAQLERAYAATRSRTGMVNPELEARFDAMAHSS